MITAKRQQRPENLGCRPYTKEKGGKAKKRRPPPHCSQVPRLVLASCFAWCLQHACYGGKTTRAPPPPNTSTCKGGGRRKKMEGGGERASTDKAAGWGGSRQRVRDGPHNICPEGARAVHAPYGGTTGGADTG